MATVFACHYTITEQEPTHAALLAFFFYDQGKDYCFPPHHAHDVYSLKGSGERIDLTTLILNHSKHSAGYVLFYTYDYANLGPALAYARLHNLTPVPFTTSLPRFVKHGVVIGYAPAFLNSANLTHITFSHSLKQCAREWNTTLVEVGTTRGINLDTTFNHPFCTVFNLTQTHNLTIVANDPALFYTLNRSVFVAGVVIFNKSLLIQPYFLTFPTNVTITVLHNVIQNTNPFPIIVNNTVLLPNDTLPLSQNLTPALSPDFTVNATLIKNNNSVEPCALNVSAIRDQSGVSVKVHSYSDNCSVVVEALDTTGFPFFKQLLYLNNNQSASIPLPPNTQTTRVLYGKNKALLPTTVPIVEHYSSPLLHWCYLLPLLPLVRYKERDEKRKKRGYAQRHDDVAQNEHR